MPQPDHHDPHDRRNGAAISHDCPTIVTDNDGIYVYGDPYDAAADWTQLAGDDRLTALRRVRAAIVAELGDTRQPDPTRQRNEHLDALATVVDALPATSPLTRNDWLNALYVARHRPD